MSTTVVDEITFVSTSTSRRWPLLAYQGYLYQHNRDNLDTSYWKCVNADKEKCKVRLTVKGELRGDPKLLVVTNAPITQHTCSGSIERSNNIIDDIKLRTPNEQEKKVPVLDDNNGESIPERMDSDGKGERGIKRKRNERQKYPTVDLTLVPLEQPYYVESFSGRRSLLAFHGYLYRQDSSYKNKQHWRCINYHKEMHCPSTLITTGDIDDASTLIVMNLKKIKYHICGRPNARSRVLYHEAAKLAMSVDDDEKGSLVQIYDEIIGGEPPEVLEQLPKKESVLEYMRKMRVKARMGGAATRVQPSGKPTAEIHEDI